MKKKFSLIDFLCRFYVYILLFVMYAPILLLIVFSFTNTKIIGRWDGFSLHLYSALFKDKEIMQAFGNTFLVAVSSAVVSTVSTGVVSSANAGVMHVNVIPSTSIMLKNLFIVFASYNDLFL